MGVSPDCTLGLQGSPEALVPTGPTSEMRQGRPREQLEGGGICPTVWGQWFIGFACALGHLGDYSWVCFLVCKMGKPNAGYSGGGTGAGAHRALAKRQTPGKHRRAHALTHNHSSRPLTRCFLVSNRERLPALVKMPMVGLPRGAPCFRVTVTEPFTIWADQSVPAPPAY